MVGAADGISFDVVSTDNVGSVGGALGAPEAFQLDIRAHGFSLTPALRAYAVEHVVAKLAKHARQIQAVVIRFDDVNGTKGGVDKRCAVEVLVRGAPTVVVDEIDADLRAAMDRAGDRALEALTRELARRRTTRRQRGRKLVRNGKALG